MNPTLYLLHYRPVCQGVQVLERRPTVQGCYCLVRCNNKGQLMPPPITERGLLGHFPRGADPPAVYQRASPPSVRSPTSSSLREILAASDGGGGARGGAGGRKSPRGGGGGGREAEERYRYGRGAKRGKAGEVRGATEATETTESMESGRGRGAE